MPQPASQHSLPAKVAASTEDLVRLRHPARELKLFPKLLPSAITAGGHQSRIRGRGMDFDEVRPYQAGDDIRSIDWRVTARTTQTHTKVFREERERPIIVVTDLRQSMFFGSQQTRSVAACTIAAALAWAGSHAGDRVGGMVFSANRQRDVRAQRSHRGVLHLIKLLSDASAALVDWQTDQFSLSTIFEDTRRIAHPGSAIIFISDFYDANAAAEQQLFELGRHCDITLCQIHDDLDLRLPPAGIYAFNDGTQRLVLNTRNQKLRKTFELQAEQRRNSLAALALRTRAAHLQIDNDNRLIQQLIAAYGNRKFRRKNR